MNDLDFGRATQSRELQDDELDAVSGGRVFRITNVRANVNIGTTTPNGPSPIQASISTSIS